MENSQSSGTIDLSKTLLDAFSLAFKHLKLIIITTTVCIALGIIYHRVATKVFESKMIIQSDILSESYSLKVAENLNNHIKDEDYDFLSSRLNLTMEEVVLLREIKVSSALTPMSQQMAEKDKIIIVISARVTDNSILPKLQDGILGYLKNNEYIRNRVREKKKELEGLIYSLDLDIKRLDTLKNKISKGILPSSKGAALSLVDVSELYSGVGVVGLYEKKFEAVSDLALVDSIQIIEDFAPFRKPVWPKLSIVLIVSFVLALIIIVSFISIKGMRNQIKSQNS